MSIDVNEEQPENISSTPPEGNSPFKAGVSQFDKSRDVNAEQFLNIERMSVT